VDLAVRRVGTSVPRAIELRHDFWRDAETPQAASCAKCARGGISARETSSVVFLSARLGFIFGAMMTGVVVTAPFKRNHRIFHAGAKKKTGYGC